MKHDTFTVAGRCQKPVKPPIAADGLLDQSLSQCTKGHCLYHQFYLPYLPCLQNV